MSDFKTLLMDIDITKQLYDINVRCKNDIEFYEKHGHAPHGNRSTLLYGTDEFTVDLVIDHGVSIVFSTASSYNTLYSMDVFSKQAGSKTIESFVGEFAINIYMPHKKNPIHFRRNTCNDLLYPVAVDELDSTFFQLSTTMNPKDVHALLLASYVSDKFKIIRFRRAVDIDPRVDLVRVLTELDGVNV